MKKIKTLLGMFLIFTGCGAVNSAIDSAATATTNTATANSLSVDLFSPAPNSGASCILRNSAGTTISGPTKTSSTGQVDFTFSASVPNSWMSIVCTGGTYMDQATHVTVTLPTTTVLRNTFYYEVGTTTSLVVTPLTEIAYKNIIGHIYQNYPAQLAQITKILGLGTEDVSDIQPTDVNQALAGTDIAGQYGILMAVLSEMIKDKPSTYPDIETLITTLFTNIKDGALASTTKMDMLAAMHNLTTNTLVQANVPASMAGLSGTQYLALNTGNAGGTLTETVYSGGTVTVNAAYSTLIATATGGTPPYHFQLDSLANGSPPVGMSVDLDGYLTGTPTVTGTYTFGVCAVDLVATSSCKSTSITVLAATAATPSSASGDYFYHWNCNGDAECLTTNPNGTATGTVNEGPGVGGQSSCKSLLTFASHFWGSAAVSSCDQSAS